jgi:thioesterase domain-containing protein
MIDQSSPVIVLSGAGGGSLDPAIFRGRVDDVTRFETIGYPGWQHYVKNGFSADMLIEFIAAQIERSVRQGQIRIVGISIGGHLGYAAALQLQASGRRIAGFCAIDTFMVTSAAPTAGWKGRALLRGSTLLHNWRLREFSRFLRSRFWRALLRLAGSRLPGLLRSVAPSGRLPWILALDPMFEEELSMRLLIRAVAPWVPSLDREPIALRAPTILLRTRLTSNDDGAWRRRCPGIQIVEIPGDHQTLLDPGNIGSLRESFVTATRDWY